MQLAITLVAMDIFFIIFRVPMLIYIMNADCSDEELLYSFIYKVLLVVGAMYSVLIFIVFIIFNKIYKNIFFQYMSSKCKCIGVFKFKKSISM